MRTPRRALPALHTRGPPRPRWSRHALHAVRVLVVCALLLVASLPVGAQTDQSVVGEPELSVFAPDNVLVPGEETTLAVYVANTGSVDRGGPATYTERVTTARATTLELTPGDAPVRIDTGRFPVGTVPTGTHGPYAFDITVADDAAAGTYELPVVLSYTYTRIVRYESAFPEREPRFSDWDTTKRVRLVVRVDDRPRFSVADVDSDVQVGSRGTVTLAVRNDGARTAREAVVTVSSTDPDVRFAGNETTAEAFVGSWEVGQTQRVAYAVSVAPDAVRRAYPLRVVVDYRDPEGVARSSPILAASVLPGPEQTFAIQRASDTLRVGAKGRLRGELVNTGTQPAADAVLVLRELPAPATAADRAYPLGDLAPGEHVPFEFVVDVPLTADPGPRRFGFVVEYETTGGYDVASERIDLSRTVAERQDVFAVEAVDATFEVDSDNRLELLVTNTGNERLTDVRAAMRADVPLSSDAPESYVGTLAPGESASIAFQVTVDDDAIATTHPVEVNFTYEDERGDTLTSAPVLVGVDIVEPTSQIPFVALVAVVAVVVFGAGWWWIRR